MFSSSAFSRPASVFALLTLSACQPSDPGAEAPETTALEAAVQGPLHGAPMALEDLNDAIAAVNATLALDTWMALDARALRLAGALAQDDGACLSFEEGEAQIEAVGVCEIGAQDRGFEGAISVTSTATGGYESFWDRVGSRDGSGRLTGSGGLRAARHGDRLDLSIRRDWTTSGGPGPSARISLHAGGALGEPGLIYAGQLMISDSEAPPTGAMRFALTERISPDTGLLTRRALISGAARWELVQIEPSLDEGCATLWRDGEIVADSCAE